MGIDFPITLAAFLTTSGIAIFAALVTLWLKTMIPNWRFTPVVVLAVSLAAALLVQCAVVWPPGASALISAFLIGFFGATLATFGYEGIANVLGLLGKGTRSEAGQIVIAQALVDKATLDGQLPPRG